MANKPTLEEKRAKYVPKFMTDPADMPALPESIRSAKAILGGQLPLPGTAVTIDYKHLPEEDWVFNVFTPDDEVIDYSKPCCRTGLSRRLWGELNLTQAEESAVLSDNPPVDLARRIYEAAAEEALSVLMELSRANPYQSERLHSRTCAAVRAELAALVAEWEALG